MRFGIAKIDVFELFGKKGFNKFGSLAQKNAKSKHFTFINFLKKVTSLIQTYP